MVSGREKLRMKRFQLGPGPDSRYSCVGFLEIARTEAHNWKTYGVQEVLQECWIQAPPFPCPRSTAYSVAPGIGSRSEAITVQNPGRPSFRHRAESHSGLYEDHRECFAAPPLPKRGSEERGRKKIATWPQMRVYRERFPPMGTTA